MPSWRIVIATAAVLALSPNAVPPKGHLVIVGGGGVPEVVAARAIALSGGPSAVVAVLPQASELKETGAEAVDFWTKAGASRAVEVSLTDRAAATAAVKQATFIWFPGGDENRLTEALKGTGLPELIRERYHGGATVGGTSAGAAVMSPVMITGDADLLSITAGKTKTADGLGLLPGAIVDQHIQKRQRMNRLISAVLDHPELVGIGINEKTAIIVSDGRRFEVVGDSSVVVIDGRRAKVSPTAGGVLAAGTGLTLDVLKPGMTFDLGAK